MTMANPAKPTKPTREHGTSSPKLIDVTVVLLENALPSTSLAPLEIFGSAGVLWGIIRGQPTVPRFRVRSVSLDGRATRHAIPVKIRPDGSLDSVKRTDLIMVPSAEFHVETAVRNNRPLFPWLRKWSERGASIAGVCTGSTLMAEAGLLDGRTATTHWAVFEQARHRYPRVHWNPERFVTESGKFFCGGGMYAAVDLSLYLVEKYCGHEVAVETAKAMLLETPRIWQTPYAAEAPRSAHGDEAIQKAQTWLFQHFRENLRIEELASRVGMSPRNLARRFTEATSETPLGYLHRLRIDAARHLLESRRKSVVDVGHAVGYEDQAFFRRLFKRYTGTSPSAYRARFGPLSARNDERQATLVAV
jgi:transcriptional regulator GlxA family with amidase domain